MKNSLKFKRKNKEIPTKKKVEGRIYFFEWQSDCLCEWKIL